MSMIPLRSVPVRRVPLLLAVVCAVGLVSGLLPAGAQPEAADDIDLLTASRDEVRAELADIEQRYSAQREQVDIARWAARDAESEAVAARSRVQDAEDRLEEARQLVAEYAVEAYMRPPAADALRVLSLADADDAGFAHNVMEIMTEDRQEVVDELVLRQDQVEKEQAAADRAADDARRSANDAEVQLVELDRVRAAQQELAARLDERLDAALAEAAAVAAIDQAAADQLILEEMALREEGPSTPVFVDTGGDVGVVGQPSVPATTTPPTTGAGPTTPTSPVPTTRPPTTRPPTTRPPTTRPPTTRPPAPRPPATPVVRPPTSGVTWADVTNVGGIYVHRSIAGNIRNLLNAATAAGLNLRGGGYRDPAAQIATRRANCGPTSYDIYEKPSSQCSPPTARPGRSMHERGMAIDFTSSGRLITSRSDRAFQWLRSNAARFGMYNLPSEPWHWSTTGN